MGALLGAAGAALGALLATALALPTIVVVALPAGGALLGGVVGVGVALVVPSPASPAQKAVDGLAQGLPVPGLPALAPLRSLQDQVVSHTVAEAELRNELASLKAEVAQAQKRAATAEAKTYTAQKSASEASKVRGAFLTRMSHELRTPLNAVIGYAEMVSDEVESAELKRDLTRIRRAGLHLKGLVTTVLDLSQLESGRYEVRPEPVDLAKLVQEIVEGAGNEAEANDNRFEVNVPSGAIATVDPRMMQSILFNLVQNGVKYTNHGTVRITVSLNAAVHVRVQDTGIGMTSRQLQQAFDPFVQGDGGTTRRYDGSGLGLAICKGFAEAMGGSIAVESEVGKGATVDVTVPLVVESQIPDDEIDEPTMLLR